MKYKFNVKWLKNRKNKRKLLKNRKNRSVLRKMGKNRKNRNLTPCMYARIIFMKTRFLNIRRPLESHYLPI